MGDALLLAVAVVGLAAVAVLDALLAVTFADWWL